jgi:hypothetical protein
VHKQQWQPQHHNQERPISQQQQQQQQPAHELQQQPGTPFMTEDKWRAAKFVFAGGAREVGFHLPWRMVVARPQRSRKGTAAPRLLRTAGCHARQLAVNTPVPRPGAPPPCRAGRRRQPHRDGARRQAEDAAAGAGVAAPHAAAGSEDHGVGRWAGGPRRRQPPHARAGPCCAGPLFGGKPPRERQRRWLAVAGWRSLLTAPPCQRVLLCNKAYALRAPQAAYGHISRGTGPTR